MGEDLVFGEKGADLVTVVNGIHNYFRYVLLVHTHGYAMLALEPTSSRTWNFFAASMKVIDTIPLVHRAVYRPYFDAVLVASIRINTNLVSHGVRRKSIDQSFSNRELLQAESRMFHSKANRSRFQRVQQAPIHTRCTTHASTRRPLPRSTSLPPRASIDAVDPANYEHDFGYSD